MAAPVRFELTHAGVRVQSLTAWLWGNILVTYIWQMVQYLITYILTNEGILLFLQAIIIIS